MKKSRKNTTVKTIIIGSIVLFGVIIRILYLIKYPIQPRDSYEYLSIIENWGIDSYYNENIYLYPLPLSCLRIIHNTTNIDLIRGGVIINMTIGILIIIFAMCFIQHYFNSFRATILSGLLTATNARLVSYSCVFLRENYYIIFEILFLNFTYKYYLQKTNCSLIICGIITAFAFLCRLEAIENIALLCTIIAYEYFTRKVIIKEALLKITCASAAFILTYCIVYFSITSVSPFHAIPFFIKKIVTLSKI